MTQNAKPNGPFQTVAPGLFLRGADHAHMEIDGRVLLAALLISLAAHVAVFWLAYGRAMGGVDASLLKPPGEVVRVQRAFEDRVVDEMDRTGPLHQPEPPKAKPPAAADLVRETIADITTGPTLTGPPTQVLATPVVAPRPLEAGPRDPGAAGGVRDPAHFGGSGNPAAPVGMAEGAGGDAGPRVELPSTLAKPNALSKGLELSYSGPPSGDPSLAVRGGGQVTGPGNGKTVAGTDVGGSGMARNLLADQSNTPGVSLGPPPLEPYRPSDKTGAGMPATRPTAGNLPRPKLDVPVAAKLPPTNIQSTEHLDDDFDYVLSVLDPVNPQRGYLRVDITPRRTLQRLRTMPKDVVFLVDTSLSIPQEWVDSVAAGIRDSLSTLNPEDRFNIVMFNQTARFFSEKGIAPATEANLAAAAEFLKHARAAGMTDVNQALTRLLVRDVAVERVYDLVLISDGKPTLGVMDTRDLINLITRDNDLAASIYCVGVGVEPNHQLLEFLAYRNRGFCVYANFEKKAATVIRDLMGRLRYPIIKDVHADVAGIDPAEVYPRDLPNIHQGQTFSIFGRWDTADRFTMRISGKNGSKPVDLTFTRDLAQGLKGEKKMAAEWAFWKLHNLYNQLITEGVNVPAVKAQIEALRKEYGLKTVY